MIWGSKGPSRVKNLIAETKMNFVWQSVFLLFQEEEELNLKYCWTLQYLKSWYNKIHFFCKFVFKAKSRWFVDIRR